MRCITAFVVVAIFAAAPAQALDVKSPGPDWTEAYHTSELVIFIKDVNEGRRIVATAEIAVRPEIIFGALSDIEHYADFMPYVEESRVLSRGSDASVITYARLAPPLVTDRDYVLKVRMTRGTASNGGAFKVEWDTVPDVLPEIDGIVRIKLNEGSWLMQPLDTGTRTRLTYTLLTNPGGLIPAFITNLSSTIAIPELFRRVEMRSVQKANAKEE